MRHQTLAAESATHMTRDDKQWPPRIASYKDTDPFAMMQET